MREGRHTERDTEKKNEGEEERDRGTAQRRRRYIPLCLLSSSPFLKTIPSLHVKQLYFFTSNKGVEHFWTGSCAHPFIFGFSIFGYNINVI